MAIALNTKIIVNAANKSFGFDLIKGEIAAIAVAPHIAVPEAINIPKLLSTLNRFARNNPIKKIIITKADM